MANSTNGKQFTGSSTVYVGTTPVYVTPTGLKIGSKGKVMDPGDVCRKLDSKGKRRRLRKELRRLARIDLLIKTL